MNKFCIFAGTTEGRKLVDFLCANNCTVTACVATEYGSIMLGANERLTVLEKRLNADEMAGLFERERFDLIVDATHPYASAVTENIKSACESTGTEYLRLQREESEEASGAVYVNDTKEAAEYLSGTEGNILLTTGSKELGELSVLKDFEKRAYARVLPMTASLESCEAAGLKTDHIIAMQGPFSESMNLALIDAVNAKFLLTKESGSAGGFAEKASAAGKAGIKLVIIGRPGKTEGYPFGEVVKLFEERFGFSNTRRVNIVGIGPGNLQSMTGEVREAVERADCLIGAGRMLEAVKRPAQPVVSLIDPVKISDFIEEHREYNDICVVMSGDTGFFSGTKKLLPLLKGLDVKVMAGLSSMSVMAASLGLSYEDVLTVSVHGRDYDVIPDVRSHENVFILTGGNDDIRRICRDLIDDGLSDVNVHIGERLSYPDQRITSGAPEKILEGEYEKLSVIWIENPAFCRKSYFGLPESAFTRGEGKKGVIPMTKPEVRAICMSKLDISDSCVCWDIGAGSGSVTVEMALAAPRGKVIAVEKDADAVNVLKQNIDRFHLKNVIVSEGQAPECLEDLPSPDRVFIGGSSGGLKEIIEIAREKNHAVKIVASAITLESVAKLTGCVKEPEWNHTEIVAVNVSAGRKAGPYHLMTAQNPIYIFTMQ